VGARGAAINLEARARLLEEAEEGAAHRLFAFDWRAGTVEPASLAVPTAPLGVPAAPPEATPPAAQDAAAAPPEAAPPDQVDPGVALEQLQEQFGAHIEVGDGGTAKVHLPDSGGVALDTYVHPDPAVQRVLEDARGVLPAHVMKVQVDLEGWTADQVARLCIILSQFASTTFSSNKWDVGHCHTLPFRLDLKPDYKVHSDRPYRYSPAMTNLIRVEIDKLLAAGIIRPSLSQWASPVVGVLKPDGTARITVNYKKLNSQTVIPQIPIPNIEDLLNSLGGSTVFTTLDITSGYFTCAIDDDAIPLTAMVTSFGLYEWTRCPQGAAGAPGHFTRLMQRVLAGLDRVQPYIDDVIVHSNGVDQHLADIQSLLERLTQHGMKMVPAKLHVGCRHVKFLGHIVGVDGIRADPSKVKALLEMPTPKTLTQLRAWLGLANYYRRFVKNMAKMVAPLTALTAKDAEIVIGPEQERAMRQVNAALALHTAMSYPDYAAAATGERPFIVATDACKDGFGAVISQKDSSMQERPIAFASRATLANEKKWSTTDLEAGAIVFGIKKFRHMLWGTPFELHTDHRALQYLDSIRERTARGARWSEFLSAFQIKIVYKKGSTHGNADGPSRNAIPATEEDAEEEEKDRLLEVYALERAAVMAAYGLANTDENWQTVHTQAASELHALYVAVDAAISEGGGGKYCNFDANCNFNFNDGPDGNLNINFNTTTQAGAARSNIIYMAALDTTATVDIIEGADEPSSTSTSSFCEPLGTLTSEQWHAAQQSDEQVAAIYSYVTTGTLPTAPAGMDSAVKRWAEHCSVVDNNGHPLLIRIPADGGQVQVVVPKTLRDQLLDALHGTAWGGHQGRQRTLERVRQCAWWPSWTGDTAYWVAHCWACQAYKRSGKSAQWPIVWRERPPFPFHTIALDFFGPLPRSAAGHSYILVAMDLYSGWVDLYPVADADFTAAGVAEILVSQHGTLHGTPCSLLSDRGSVFMAKLAQAFYEHMGIHKLSTTAYRPQCNGKVERFMQELAVSLAMCADSAKADWHKWLPYAAFSHNTATNRHLGASAFLLTTGREARVALHCLLGNLLPGTAAMDAMEPAAQQWVEQLLARQREAGAVAEQRHALRKAKVLRENAALETAMGLRDRFEKGELVWYYRAPRTHSAWTVEDSTEVGRVTRTTFSKKMLDCWLGPYRVLAVGPVSDGDELVSHSNLLLDMDGKRTRVHKSLCKPHKDALTDPHKPASLPTGFAKYLVAKCWRGADRPSALGTDDVEADNNRHGVAAILKHRLILQARGRGRSLQYLVKWDAAPGEDSVDTWEPADHMDACPDVVTDYWASLDDAEASIPWAREQLVKEQLVRARKARGVNGVVATCGRGEYALAPGAITVQPAPTLGALKSANMVGLGIMVVFSMREPSGLEYLQWYEGSVTAVPSKRTHKWRVYWVAEGKYAMLELSRNKYCADAGACEGSWFLFGSADKVAALQQ
jgi:hypothetical protein